jgi:CRISPR-associated protein Cas1
MIMVMSDVNACKMVIIPLSAVAEYQYCPRSFYYRMVEGADEANHLLIEGRLQEKAREERATQFIDGVRQKRRVVITSDYYGISGEIDVIEEKAGHRYPVEYKRGFLKEAVNDDVQLCCQVMLLEEVTGLDIPMGYIYYAKSAARREVPVTSGLRELTLDTIASARQVLEDQVIPPPVNDERCRGCSLAPRCLPEETAYLNKSGPAPRRTVPSNNLGRVLYVDTYGAYLRKREGVINISKDKETLQEIPMTAVDQVVMVGQVNATTPLLNELLRRGIATYFCNYSGRLSGWLQPAWGKNCLLRIAQFQGYNDAGTKLSLSRSFVCGKLANYRVLVMRYNRSINIAELEAAADTISRYLKKAAQAASINELLGLEGIASRCWFESLPLMIKREETCFFFSGRSRRPPRDPINAMLSFAYSMLAKDIIGELMRVGLDPYIGFLHSPVYGRPALALDLMEEFRPIIADSAVLTAVNTGMVNQENFEDIEMNCLMNEKGRKSFFKAYRNRMNDEITHPVFNYRLSYRRIIELQARLLAKVLRGEIKEYTPFVVR